ncbi:MAG: FHA domain-containing protein, partial [Planctomycetota bacterium]
VRDLQSRNGTKVNGRTIVRKRLDPGDTLSIAKHSYTIEYDPQELGAFGPPPPDDDHVEELLRSSLMDRAGLTRRSRNDRYKNRDPRQD